MATKKKLLEAAAGSAGGGAGLDVSEVFSTYLYTGNGSTQTITNGIDLAGEGGLVWIKCRQQANAHILFDTERGFGNYLSSPDAGAENYAGNLGWTSGSFNSDGFTTVQGTNPTINGLDDQLVSWTWRKAPRFFDYVTYTGDNTTSRQISHNLGCSPGAIIVKSLNTAQNWVVYHKDLDQDGSTVDSNNLFLNTTGNQSGGGAFGDDIYQTSTHFTLGRLGSGFNDRFNKLGTTYVAYLFAHNDGDGEFGPTGDQDIIKCGSYTGTGSSGNFVDLGFEPQFMLIKNTSSTSNWIIHDNMRGMIEATGNVLFPNVNNAENTTAFRQARPNPTGITFFDGNSETNGSGANYIYIAIRRGPMAVPESGSEVFAVDTAGGTSPTPPTFVSGFPVDLHIYKNSSVSGTWNVQSRLTGFGEMHTNETSAEAQNNGTYYEKDYMNGVGSNTGTNTNAYQWMWKRAPSFFDCVAYTGNGVAGRTVSHNLGVAPEMMWVKQRNVSRSWAVYSKDISETEWLYLNGTNGVIDNTSNIWNDTRPTDSVFYVSSNQLVNLSGGTYVAYLFASLDGVSKVGSYTGNGSTQTIDCGFSSGARFVLIKRTDSTGDWYIWDTERGIVAANDPHLSLNTTAAEVTTDDSIDPASSGFAVNQVAATNINVSSATYIFYAVA